MGVRVVRAISAVFLAAAALTPAMAADKKTPDKPLSIQLTAVALPVIVDNRLLNYVFVKVKLDLAAGADGAAVRAKEPYFRASLMRAGHHSPFTLATDYTKLDAVKIRAEVLRDAAVILGPGVVHDAEIVSQAPEHWVPVPRVQPPRAGAPSSGAPEPAEPQGPEIIP